MSVLQNKRLVKARLTNSGKGVLEINIDAIRFFTETGRFRKQRKIVREIPISDVEGVDRQGNDLSVTWKGTIDMFVIEQQSEVDQVYERITASLKERAKEAEKEKETVAVEQEESALAHATADAMEAANSLFDVLGTLHGRVDWKLVEASCKRSEENIAKLTNQGEYSLSLDVKPLSAAMLGRHPREVAQKVFDVLKTLYEHFDQLASSAKEDAAQTHPNPSDARLVLRALYVLNDMRLGAIVGDEEVARENPELLKALDDLSKLPWSKIDVKAAKASLDKFFVGKESQSDAFEEIKSMLEQALKVTSEGSYAGILGL
jgi:hypothetical protein